MFGVEIRASEKIRLSDLAAKTWCRGRRSATRGALARQAPHERTGEPAEGEDGQGGPQEGEGGAQAQAPRLGLRNPRQGALQGQEHRPTLCARPFTLSHVRVLFGPSRAESRSDDLPPLNTELLRLWQRTFLETSTVKDLGRLAKGIEIIDERTVRPSATVRTCSCYGAQGYQILYRAPDDVSRPARVVLPILTTLAKVPVLLRCKLVLMCGACRHRGRKRLQS